MNLSEQTISALGSIITGDKQISPYRTGLQLIDFFRAFGLDDVDVYGIDFVRGRYTKAKLHIFNNTPTMKNILEAAFHPLDFLYGDKDIQNAVDYLNEFLKFDGYQLIGLGNKWEVHTLIDSQIDLLNPYENSVEITHIFIDEQIKKCDKKLTEGDFDGAITNARSLIEAVLSAIEKEFDPQPPKYDGNLPKLYRRVQNHLNLSPGECLQQILSGLTSVVSGLATLRNTMSDSHVISYKPSEHHAKLAVNSAKTLCNFLFDTKEYQMKKR